ncbi:MAG: hypothetical protein CSB44_01285 [Gammaproteobacteria bacterium]|nr:MAG: hypothetical protein CSB44_01285 [Gammaproteobacteria bacterium]
MESLVKIFGNEAVGKAVSNLTAEVLKAGLDQFIDRSQMPDFAKDMAKQVVEDTLGQFKQEGVGSEVEDAVNKEMGDDVKDQVDDVMQTLKQCFQEETNESGSSEGAEGSEGGKGGGKGGMNWLETLAKALGKVAGQHLDKMVELGKKMGTLGGQEGKEGVFAETQSQFQASSQMLKMSMEGIGTMVRSIGQGMSKVASDK